MARYQRRVSLIVCLSALEAAGEQTRVPVLYNKVWLNGTRALNALSTDTSLGYAHGLRPNLVREGH